MIKKNRVAVLVVAFLGVPETASSKLLNSEIRYFHTKKAFLEIKENINDTSLFFGLVGDPSECNKLINECNLSYKNAKWFDQDRALIKRGTGALENQLIVNCIKNWSLDKNFDFVVKVTGKYQVLNIHKIINFSMFITQPFYAWKILFNKMVDTRVFIFNPFFYLQKQISFQNIDSMPGFWIENIVFDVMKDCGFRFGIVINRPILKGLAGTTNEFSTTPFYKRALIYFLTELDIMFMSLFNKIKLIFGKKSSDQI